MATAAERVLVSWSGGKDSCMALHTLRSAGDYEVVGLLTTVRQEDGRVGMHGVSRDLIELQARAFGLPVTIVEVPVGASNIVYEQALAAGLQPSIDAGVRTLAFGDLFLADIQSYREQLVARLGLRSIFPVWGRDTREFVEEFIELGFQAVVVSIDPTRLDAGFAGRLIDGSFVAALPADVDPCGENGEFHSFVFGGPGVKTSVNFIVGQQSVEDGICYRAISAGPNGPPAAAERAAPRGSRTPRPV
jgi:uncharacterized protein (TIGR00290 family)